VNLGVVLFLPAKKHLEIFNPTEHKDDEGTNSADDKHAFENSHNYRDDLHTHTQSMVFETRPV